MWADYSDRLKDQQPGISKSEKGHPSKMKTANSGQKEGFGPRKIRENSDARGAKIHSPGRFDKPSAPSRWCFSNSVWYGWPTCDCARFSQKY